MSTGAEAAERLLARKMSPTGTNLPMDVETVARAVLAGEQKIESLCGALTSIISRYETAEELELSGHLWKGPARAMMLDAVKELAEAFPEDRFYHDRADRLGV